MVLSKKMMMMGGISLAAVAALVVLAGVGSKNQMAAVEAATSTPYTLTLDKNNSIPSTDTTGGTYNWDTATSDTQHISWHGIGVNYVANNFLHIAQTSGEFYNTITLHQITSVTANGSDTLGGTDGDLLFYSSTDGTNWIAAGTNGRISSGNPVTFSASAGIGFIRFSYDRSAGTNYVTSISINYNCVSD